MPLLISNTIYRTFDSGKVLESESIAQVRQIYEPVDKQFVLLAPDTGLSGLVVYKFDLASVAADDSDLVLQPANPFYNPHGRWIKVATASQSGGGGGGGNAQFVLYSVAPPANPTDTAQPAMAYDPAGILPIMVWDNVGLAWN